MYEELNRKLYNIYLEPYEDIIKGSKYFKSC